MGNNQEYNEAEVRLSNMEIQMTWVFLNMSQATITMLEIKKSIFTSVIAVTYKKNELRLHHESSFKDEKGEHGKKP